MFYWTLIIVWMVVRGGKSETIVAGGASFPSVIYHAWFQDYSRNENFSLGIQYKATGSTTGKLWIKGGIDREKYPAEDYPTPVVFVGSDSSLSEADFTDYPHLQMFPTVAGSVVICYNLPGISQLNLKQSHISDIYMGRLQWWNDSSIVDFNPDVTLPAERIIPIARRDGSGTTGVFTDGLSGFSPEWKSLYKSFSKPKLKTPTGPSEAWPVNGPKYYAYKGQGMAAMIASIPYSIGYLSTADAVEWNLDDVAIENKYGDLVGLADIAEGTAIAMDFFANNISSRMFTSLVNAPSQGAYPLATFTYMIVNMSTTPGIPCEEMMSFVKLMEHCLSSERTEQIARDLLMIPLTKNLQKIIRDRVLTKIRCKGRLVVDLIKEDFAARALALETGLGTIEIIIIALISLLVLMIIVLLAVRYKYMKATQRRDWILDPNDIKVRPPKSATSSKTTTTSAHSTTYPTIERDSLQFLGTYLGFRFFDAEAGTLQERTDVLIHKSYCTKSVLQYDRKVYPKIWRVHSKVKHEMVLPFLGMIMQDKNVPKMIFMTNTTKTLHGTLVLSPYELKNSILSGFAKDLASGLSFLHKLDVVHGMLDPWNVFIDNKWTIKIGNWMQNMISFWNGTANEDMMTKGRSDMDQIDDSIAKRLMFRHPELLMGKVDVVEKKHDQYSFGMVCWEIFTRKLPYQEGEKEEEGHYKRVLKNIIDNARPPALDLSKMLPEIGDILRGLIRPKPTLELSDVVDSLDFEDGGNEGIVESLMASMEEYSHDLKKISKQMEGLLNRMLPASVAKALQEGKTVKPEFYKAATIFFSDVVGFTSICSESTPVQVVQMLNDLYTLFDAIIDKYDVYKVETIGDAYMCSSGLPQRNGNEHVRAIARTALDIISGIKTFKIKHRPSHAVAVRIGLNSGPTTAGVVGLSMPRYCLFGDTVNVASRMESTGEGNRIQVTKNCKDLLNAHYPAFHLEPRPNGVEAKGKGRMETFWLMWEDTTTAYEETPVLDIHDIEDEEEEGGE